MEKGMLREKLLALEEAAQGFSLPVWEELPALPLYMDQVIFLLNQYLSWDQEQMQEKPLTPAMINNYVKLKIIPPPEKKRYSRRHLAWLVMVCLLKQTLSTNDIRRMLPVAMSEEEEKELYSLFLAAFAKSREDCRQAVRKAAAPVLETESGRTEQLVFQGAAAAFFFRLVTERMLSTEQALTEKPMA